MKKKIKKQQETGVSWSVQHSDGTVSAGRAKSLTEARKSVCAAKARQKKGSGDLNKLLNFDQQHIEIPAGNRVTIVVANEETQLVEEYEVELAKPLCAWPDRDISGVVKSIKQTGRPL